MNRRKTFATAVTIGCLGVAMGVHAASNIDPANKFGWGENIGWTNWADANGGADGVEVLADHLQGFIWGENVGWINTGNGGGPYLNTDNTNFGVNILGSGFCDGFAWGENIGWINFGTEPFVGVDGAQFDDVAGRFRGYAWGENVGWINLDEAEAGKFVAVNPAPVCCLGNADKVSPGQVTFADVTAVLGNWLAVDPSGNGPGDANCDGAVNFADVTTVLGNWLNLCP